MAAFGRHVSKLSAYAPALPTPFGGEGNVDVAVFERSPMQGNLLLGQSILSHFRPWSIDNKSHPLLLTK